LDYRTPVRLVAASRRLGLRTDLTREWENSPAPSGGCGVLARMRGPRHTSLVTHLGFSRSSAVTLDLARVDYPISAQLVSSDRLPMDSLAEGVRADVEGFSRLSNGERELHSPNILA